MLQRSRRRPRLRRHLHPLHPSATLGYLQILTNVPGSQIWVGDEAEGYLEPANVLNLPRGLPAGQVEVRASAPGYQETRQRVDIPSAEHHTNVQAGSQTLAAEEA